MQFIVPHLIFSPKLEKNEKMLDFPEDVARAFQQSSTVQTTDDVRLLSGINKLLLGRSSIQDHLFEPCGYSINALSAEAYTTIHVAPEVKKSATSNLPYLLSCLADVRTLLSTCVSQEGNRYASFETNSRQKDYTQLVESILSIFRPSKFTMVRY